MYWRLVERAIERRSETFDFGRSTVDSGTYEFKKKWGAMPQPVEWKYYVRRGDQADLRLENPKFSLAVRAWRRLPVKLTKVIGPYIVRGIP
jgi:hypothetical protein